MTRAVLLAVALCAVSLPTAPASAQARPGGRYECFAFLNGALVRVLTPFTILGTGYVSDTKEQGTIAFDTAAGTVTFSGGPLNGETAAFEGGKLYFGRRKSVTCEAKG